MMVWRLCKSNNIADQCGRVKIKYTCMCITLKTSALESAFAARLDQSLAMKQKISSPLGYTIQRQEDMAMRDHAAYVTISPY